MSQQRIAAIILAAGYSSRMGDFKPLLPLNGRPVIANSIESFRKAGITDIRVVVGYRAHDLIPVIEGLGLTPILNEKFDSGMFSSVQAGLSASAHDIEGFFLLPADTPLVKSDTIEILIEKYLECKCSVINPTFLGRKGHPPFISKKCFRAILDQDISGNLRSVLQQFKQDACNVPCIDQGILLDMDTPVDYQKLISLPQGKIPSLKECQRLLSLYHVPESVINHGWAVAKTAGIIARHINRLPSYRLDLELIATSGLLHDIAKGVHEHAKAGAVILEQEGFPAVAKVISTHMDIELNEENPLIDEASLIYLADKITKEAELIPIEKRFAKAKERYAHDKHVLQNIEKRMGHAILLKEKIEYLLDLPDLYSVVKEQK
jgi:molybdenum cofactor cytidylyltransferase